MKVPRVHRWQHFLPILRHSGSDTEGSTEELCRPTPGLYRIFPARWKHSTRRAVLGRRRAQRKKPVRSGDTTRELELAGERERRSADQSKAPFALTTAGCSCDRLPSTFVMGESSRASSTTALRAVAMPIKTTAARQPQPSRDVASRAPAARCAGLRRAACCHRSISGVRALWDPGSIRRTNTLKRMGRNRARLARAFSNLRGRRPSRVALRVASRAAAHGNDPPTRAPAARERG
jgi:hypothetical protein